MLLIIKTKFQKGLIKIAVMQIVGKILPLRLSLVKIKNFYGIMR
jgi:hypothetical protein